MAKRLQVEEGKAAPVSQAGGFGSYLRKFEENIQKIAEQDGAVSASKSVSLSANEDEEMRDDDEQAADDAWQQHENKRLAEHLDSYDSEDPDLRAWSGRDESQEARAIEPLKVSKWNAQAVMRQAHAILTDSEMMDADE